VTETEARALTIGAPVKDNGPGVGTVVEKHLDFFSIKWTAPPTRVEGVSTFLYEDCELLSSGAAPLPGFWLLPDSDPAFETAGPVSGGDAFTANVAGSVVAARFWRAAADSVLTRTVRFYKGSTLTATSNPSVETAGYRGWVTVTFPASIPVAALQVFSVVVDVEIYSQHGALTDIHPEVTWNTGMWGTYGSAVLPPNNYPMTYMVDARWV